MSLDHVPTDFSSPESVMFFESYTPKDLRFVLITKLLSKGPLGEGTLKQIFENVVSIEQFINSASDGGINGGKAI